MIELWDELDEHGRRTGKTIRRGDPMHSGQFHLVVDVWIRNRNRKFLISRRSPNKIMPNMWETTSGSAIAGEDSKTAALREAKEEVGITLSPGNGRLIRREIRRQDSGSSILETWLFEEPISDQEPVCQDGEVSEAKWATKSEILSMIQERVFINHLDAGLSELD